MLKPKTLHALALAWLRADKNPPCPEATRLGYMLVKALRDYAGIYVLTRQKKALQLHESGTCFTITELDLLPNRILPREIRELVFMEG